MNGFFYRRCRAGAPGRRRWYHLYHRFIDLRGSPRQIALGFALGIFVGMSPFMMCHTILAVFFAAVFKWNKLSAAAGVFITNPVTAPVIYPAVYWVGSFFISVRPGSRLPDAFTFDAIQEWITRTPELLYVLSVGGIITGIPMAVIGYLVAYRLILKYRSRHAHSVSLPS